MNQLTPQADRPLDKPFVSVSLPGPVAKSLRWLTHVIGRGIAKLTQDAFLTALKITSITVLGITAGDRWQPIAAATVICFVDWRKKA